MRATIENSFELKEVSKDGNLNNFTLEFNLLLITITISKDENMLRKFMNDNFKKSTFFKYGFGASHMWVNQINVKDRLLIVYF